jgi:hypothetical protein
MTGTQQPTLRHRGEELHSPIHDLVLSLIAEVQIIESTPRILMTESKRSPSTNRTSSQAGAKVASMVLVKKADAA